MKPTVRVVDNDKGFHALMLAVEKVRRGVHVRVGLFDDGSVVDGMSTAELGGIHEFGSRDGHIPERSFLRSTVTRLRTFYADAFTKIVGAFLDGKLDLNRGMEGLGIKAAKDVQATIRAGIDPANAPSTIARKGSSKPLIDTGRLLGAISHLVVWGEK